jgi:hypothetical protein
LVLRVVLLLYLQSLLLQLGVFIIWQGGLVLLDCLTWHCHLLVSTWYACHSCIILLQELGGILLQLQTVEVRILQNCVLLLRWWGFLEREVVAVAVAAALWDQTSCCCCICKNKLRSILLLLKLARIDAIFGIYAASLDKQQSGCEQQKHSAPVHAAC